MRAHLTPEEHSSARGRPTHPGQAAGTNRATPDGSSLTARVTDPVTATMSTASASVPTSPAVRVPRGSTALEVPPSAGLSSSLGAPDAVASQPWDAPKQSASPAQIHPTPGVTSRPSAAIHEAEAPSPLTALVAGAQAGDAEAVETLMREVRRRAVRYARARLGPFPHAAHAAEDVAQEVCIAVLTSLSTYHERGVPFESFVYAICVRKVADVQRALYRGPDLSAGIPDGLDPDADPAVQTVRRDEAGQAWALLDHLPDQQREVLTLRVAVGLSATETAAALDMTAGSVRVSQHRALNRLRELMPRQETAG